MACLGRRVLAFRGRGIGYPRWVSSLVTLPLKYGAHFLGFIMPVTAFDPNSSSKKMIFDNGDGTHYNLSKDPNSDTMLARTPQLGPQQPSASLPVTFANDVITDAGVFSALNTDLLTGVVSGWFDASSFHSAAFQIIGSAGISAGQIIFEQTNDITKAPNGSTMPVQEPAVLASVELIGAQTIAASTQRMFVAPITCKYVRIRIGTAFVGGTVSAVAAFSQAPFTPLRSQVLSSVAGNFNITSAALPAGSNTIGGFFDTAVANAGGYGAPFKLLSSAATTNATLVKASAGRAYRFKGKNNVASVRYLKLFNKATAPVTGTDTPTETFILEPNAPFDIIFEKGRYFATGVGFAITGAIADNDNTAIAAGDIIGLMIYYA